MIVEVQEDLKEPLLLGVEETMRVVLIEEILDVQFKVIVAAAFLGL